MTKNHPQVRVKKIGYVNAEMMGVYLEREPGAERGLCELTFRLQLTPELEQVVKVDLWLD